MPRDMAGRQHPRVRKPQKDSRPSGKTTMPRTTVPAPFTSRAVDKRGATAYFRYSGDERTSPGLAAEARRIHAEGYLAAGFVNDHAKLDASRLSAAWSIGNECDTKYFVVVNPNEPVDRATARQLRPSSGQDYDSLPGLRICDDVISTTGRALLEAAAARGPVIEISGLARSSGGSPFAVHEVIRWMVQEADDAETWVFAIVGETLQSLRRTYGHDVFEDLGGEVAREATVASRWT